MQQPIFSVFIENPKVNVPQEGWDGKMHESPVIQGVYAYIIDVEVNGKRKNIIGSVTVMK